MSAPGPALAGGWRVLAILWMVAAVAAYLAVREAGVDWIH